MMLMGKMLKKLLKVTQCDNDANDDVVVVIVVVTDDCSVAV